MMEQMSAMEQADVRSAVDRIARHFDPDRVKKVNRLAPGREPFFDVLRATPALRVFFERVGNLVRVLDVASDMQMAFFRDDPAPTPR